MYKKIKISPTEYSDNTIKRISDKASIPFEDGNRDYEEYKRWCDGYELIDNEWVKTSEGNEPEPADE